VIIENKKFNLSFSIGIAIYPVDSNDIETLFKYADIAMYKAKKEGKNRYEFINEKLKEEIKVQYEISNQIKEGIEKGEFELYFQPQIDVLTNTVYGAEGLIRWNHPKKGLIGPNVFIPISETGDLIYLIDEYVIEEAFKTIKKWSNDPLLNHLKLAVNISAKEFKKNTFIPKLKNLLEKYKIDPEKLEIEITESVSMQNVTYTIKTLEEIKKLGFSISVDDFGTGYSSLNYLKMIPFDIIKIDRSFIKDILNDNDDYLITKMIIEVSKILNKQNIAEGVETPDVLKKIKELGCRYVQGYYFSKPLNYQSFYEFVKKYGKS
jgi:EAL domain-containing protein (putative c-di-GMP-specific phosphodiesterase class I)